MKHLKETFFILFFSTLAILFSLWFSFPLFPIAISLVFIFLLGIFFYPKMKKKFHILFFIISFFSFSPSYATSFIDTAYLTSACAELSSLSKESILGHCPKSVSEKVSEYEESLKNSPATKELPSGSKDELIAALSRQHSDPLVTKYPSEDRTYLEKYADICQRVGKYIPQDSKQELCEDSKVTTNCIWIQTCLNVMAEIDDRNTPLVKPISSSQELGKANCWVCNLGCRLMASSQIVLETSMEPLKTMALTLLGLGLLFWIAIRTLIFFGQIGAGKNSDYINDLAKRFATVLICAALLWTGIGIIYELALTPLISVSSYLSQKIVDPYDIKSARPKSFIDFLDEKTYPDKTKEEILNSYCPYCEQASAGRDYTSKCNLSTLSGATIMSDLTLDRVICMGCVIFHSLLPYQMIASQWLSTSLVHEAPRWLRWLLGIEYILWPTPFMMFLCGLSMAICLFIIQLILGLELIRIFFNLALFSILLPFFITFFAFPSTRQYTKKGWTLFVDSLAQLVGLSIAVAFILALFNYFYSTEQTVMRLAETMSNKQDYSRELYGAMVGGFWGGFKFIFILILITGFSKIIVKSVQSMISTLTGVNFPDATAQTIEALKSGVKLAAGVLLSSPQMLGKFKGAIDKMRKVGGKKSSPSKSSVQQYKEGLKAKRGNWSSGNRAAALGAWGKTLSGYGAIKSGVLGAVDKIKGSYNSGYNSNFS